MQKALFMSEGKERQRQGATGCRGVPQVKRLPETRVAAGLVIQKSCFLTPLDPVWRKLLPDCHTVHQHSSIVHD